MDIFCLYCKLSIGTFKAFFKIGNESKYEFDNTK